MTFYEKYPQLQDKEFLTKVLTETVFSTMSLENQQVPKAKVQEIILRLLTEDELEKTQLSINQAQ